MTFARTRAENRPLITGPAQAGVAFAANGAVTFTALAAAWTSQDIQVDVFSELAIDINATVVTTNYQVTVQRKGLDGVYYTIATSAVKTGSSSSLSLGAGFPNVADVAAGATSWSVGDAFGDIVRIVVTPTGALTATLSVKGK